MDEPVFNPFDSQDISPAYSEHWAAKRRLAQALRELTDVLITSTPSVADMNEIAARLELQASQFANTVRRYGLAEFVADGDHGGYVAAIFDQFMGMAQLLGKSPGMTGTLKVRYLRPTPLNTRLQLRAELDRVDGRKTLMNGTMQAGDKLTASCEALFVRPAGGYSDAGLRS